MSNTVHHTKLLVLCLLPASLLNPSVPAQDFGGNQLQWAGRRTSAADALISEADSFDHGVPSLNANEVFAFRTLIAETERRRQQLRRQKKDKFISEWESAFYRFEQLRRAAWSSGALKFRSATSVDRADPFRSKDADVSSSVSRYTLSKDLLTSPHDFVGRPVVLRGVLRRPVRADEGASTLSFTDAENNEPEAGALIEAELFPLGDATSTSTAVIRTPAIQMSGAGESTDHWPARRFEVPVLIKGWVVKLWDERPLIYCDSVREISAEPWASLIRRHAANKKALQEDEAWLFHESLLMLEDWDLYRHSGHAEAADSLTHRAEAARFLDARLASLLRDMAKKAVEDEEALKAERDAGRLSGLQFEFRKKRLDSLWKQRTAKFDRAHSDPREFETYVDLFTNNDVWQGQMVTLRGHVRHVLSYPATDVNLADELRYRHPPTEASVTADESPMLHELWLYTDDSQNNPAVIVTTQLPPAFPADAEIIDHVSVTGCFFKPYVYRSQTARRIAPLILAADVWWAPTESQIISLADDGHLSESLPIVERARENQTSGPTGMALLLVSTGAIMTVMIIWGQAVRERRNRRNLLRRMEASPEFESVGDGQYAPRLTDYTAGYDL